MLFCMVQPSVDVVYIHRYAGLNSLCKWFTVIGIFIWCCGRREDKYRKPESGTGTTRKNTDRTLKTRKPPVNRTKTEPLTTMAKGSVSFGRGTKARTMGTRFWSGCRNQSEDGIVQDSSHCPTSGRVWIPVLMLFLCYDVTKDFDVRYWDAVSKEKREFCLIRSCLSVVWKTIIMEKIPMNGWT